MRRPGSIRSTVFVALLAAFVLITSILFFREARNFIGESFPGFLQLENGMVGAFSGFDWPGYEAGLRYHDMVSAASFGEVVFSLKDFLVTFFATYAAGMCYLIFALIIFIVGRHMRGIVPFVCFNLGIAYYLIASFDFHLGHHASWFFLLNFVVFPACMSHFALVFPEEVPAVRRRPWLVAVPYVISLVIFVPYVYTFYRAPLAWISWEGVAVAYVVLSYFFWIAMLARNARYAAHDTDRTAASYLLLGQLIAFLIPLTAAVAIFVFGRNVPLNAIAPVTVVLPIASLFGIVLGNLRNAQLKLVQSEKMASLGHLVAGVAHEINNPTTFIYSNIAALRDYVAYMKDAVRADAPAYKGQMSSAEVMGDLEELVDTVAEGADRIKSIVSDLRRFGHSQDDVVARVELKPGIESSINLLKHEVGAGVTVHLDVPEDLSVTANGGQINQVWMNLLANAIYAVGEEGTVWISAFDREGRVIVEIRDDGKGIAPKDLGHIFDPFYTTKPEGQGTGLGLAICQQIVHRWNGEITVDSVEGKGTVVRVSFSKETKI